MCMSMHIERVRAHCMGRSKYQMEVVTVITSKYNDLILIYILRILSYVKFFDKETDKLIVSTIKMAKKVLCRKPVKTEC